VEPTQNSGLSGMAIIYNYLYWSSTMTTDFSVGMQCDFVVEVRQVAAVGEVLLAEREQVAASVRSRAGWQKG
jgi:hypothetical protein